MATRVLIVDDSATVRRLVATVLREGGYDVTDASDGLRALEIARQNRFDLVLLDFVMPKLNGYQLAHALRAVPAMREVPIVLMSARAEQIGERFIKQTGAVDAITKPFPPETLLTLIGHVMGRRSRRPEPTLVRADLEASMPEIRLDEVKEQGTEVMRLGPNGIPLFADNPTEPEPLERATVVDPGARNTVPDAPRSSGSSLAQVVAINRAADQLSKLLGPKLLELARGPRALDQSMLLTGIQESLDPSGLAALLRALRPFDEDLRGTVAFEGSVALCPLGEVLQLLRLQMQTGLFVVQRRNSEVVVAFNNGAVDLALARNVSAEFLLQRYLLALKVIDRERLDRLMAEHDASSGVLGDYLVRSGQLRQEDLERALQRQTAEVIYEMLRWQDGRYRFEHGVVLPEAKAAGLGLPIESMVLEGFRRVDEWRLMESDLPNFDLVVFRDQQVIDSIQSRMAPDEIRVMESVDGRRTVREIMTHTAMNSFDVCSVIYRLLRSKALRKRNA